MINKERLVNTFLEIVQIDSPTGEEQEMVSYAETLQCLVSVTGQAFPLRRSQTFHCRIS